MQNLSWKEYRLSPGAKADLRKVYFLSDRFEKSALAFVSNIVDQLETILNLLDRRKEELFNFKTPKVGEDELIILLKEPLDDFLGGHLLDHSIYEVIALKSTILDFLEENNLLTELGIDTAGR